jgi:predicted permease
VATIFEGLDRGLERLRRSGTFVFVSVASLAISMGAATTMFTVVNSFLFSSLPYQNPDRLVMVWHHQDEGTEQGEALPLSPGAFSDLRGHRDSLEQVAGFFSESVNLTDGDEASRVHALFVTDEFFSMLGRPAAIGRTLGAEDTQEDTPAVVVISHEYWQRQFGADPSILERTVEFGGRVHEVAGVLPADFRFSESLVATDPALSRPVDLWVPFALGDRASERGFHYLTTIARMTDGASLPAVRGEIEAYTASAAEQYPDTDRDYRMSVIPLRDQIFGSLQPVLLTLWAATLFILLIACVNLATLLLARMHKRRRDTGVRLALGASRSRIIREALEESVFLAVVGGLLSLGVAFLAIRLLTVLNPVSVFRSYPPQIDVRVVLFTIGLSVVAGVSFGVLPAIRASRTDFATAMSAGTVRLTGRSRLAFTALVATQIALATTLLIGMGLSFRSFQTLLHADLGLRIDRVATFDVFLPSAYRDTSRRVGFLGELLDRMEALPGVESLAMNYALPFSGVNPSNGFEIEGREVKDGESLSANLGLVNREYFETLGIPLLQGRSFQQSDTVESVPVAIVDEQMVRRYFGGRDPLGRRISIASDTPLTIVGVVGAVKQDALEDEGRPYVYLPYQQRCYMFSSFAIKTDLENPLSLAESLRAAVRDLDRGVPISRVTTLEHSYRSAIAPHRFSLLLMSIFAGVSLFLTIVGIYGVMSFLVRQREQEAGIRMALGATPQQIFGLIFKQGLVLSLAGTATGLGMAVAAGRVLENLAYGVETLDSLVFSIVPAVTLLGAFIAYYPAARALSRVDPNESLRGS